MKNTGILWVLCFTIIAATSCTVTKQIEVDSDTNTGSTTIGDAVQETLNGRVDEDQSVENLDGLSRLEAMNVSEIVENISDTIQSDNNFRTCLQSNIDMCIDESFIMKWEMPNCSDYVMKKNRKSCEIHKVMIKAKDAWDISICSRLQDNKASCEFEVIVQNGKKDFNTAICERLEWDYKISCNNEIVRLEAMEKKDIKICDKMIAINSNDAEENYEASFCREEVGFLISEQK